MTIDPGGPGEREVDALADAEPVRAGEVIRIRTTGGGGWGDPLDRDPALVVRDVPWREVSAAWRTTASCSPAPSTRTRSAATSSKSWPSGRPHHRGDAFFDRGPGYATLAGGAVSADVDRRGDAT